MKIKGIFANSSVWSKLLILLFFFLIGLIFGSSFEYAIMKISGSLSGNASMVMIEQPFCVIMAMQFLSSVFSIFFPAVCMAYFCSEKPKDFLCVNTIPKWNIFILALLMLLSVLPAIEISSWLNTKMQLPHSMVAIETWMRNMENNAKLITAKILSEKGFLPFSVNVFVIAGVAGVAEEFLFRGALLSIIRQKVKNPHVAIWIVAAIFSAIHFQFYGFIPRMLLGGFLGYLLYWTNSIWVPVFVHFANNALAIIVSSKKSFEDSPFFNENITTSDLSKIWLPAVIGIIFFVMCVRFLKKSNSERCK